MDVMSIRYSGRYEFHAKVAVNTLTHPMPSMLLQPLAENAVKHAFHGLKGSPAKRKKRNVVFLETCYLPENVLLIRLVDNGRGMTKEELDYLHHWKQLPDEVAKPKKDSISIQNIYKRLKLYHSDCQIDYYTKEGYYTIIEIKIPFLASPLPSDDRKDH